ncbi:MAG: competence/damage-inducible protein A [candidate division KSB1 bacterium]|nr:competence/damage-inducible protein A [candidate division KSB1 bacterium]
MKIEIISIGDELLIGQTVNTNAAWMGEQLLLIGAPAEWVTTVGDSRANLLEALRIAESRADVVLITGGLGPTHDDVTKSVCVEYFASRLVLNEAVLEAVRERFRRRGIEMAKVNEEQALVPHNAEIIPNSRGTAPGMIFRKGDKAFYVMPGVPFEMKEMMIGRVLPELKARLGGRVIAVRNLMTTGVPESALYQQLDNLPLILERAQAAFLPNLYGVKIRLMAAADCAEEAERRVEEAANMVKEKLGDCIYAETDIPLEAALAELLRKAKKTLALAESCTGGHIANLFTNISGSSEFFERGLVTYSNRAKMELLGVPAETIRRYGAVSAETAVAMAEGVRRNAGTDYGLAVTGIAGPTGGTPEKPVGLVFVACSDADGVVWERHQFIDDRLGNKQRSAQAAMNLLRKRILGMRHG